MGIHHFISTAAFCFFITDPSSRPFRQVKEDSSEKSTLLLSINAVGKSCTFYWIPAHGGIEVDELADSFTNKARTIELVLLSVTVFDAQKRSSAQTRGKNLYC